MQGDSKETKCELVKTDFLSMIETKRPIFVENAGRDNNSILTYTVNRGNFGRQSKFGQPPNFSPFHFISMRLSKYPLTAVFLVISRLHLVRIIRYNRQEMFCYLIRVSLSDVILKLFKF